MDPNLLVHRFERYGMEFEAVDGEVVVWWPEADETLLAGVGHRKLTNQCYHMDFSSLSCLPVHLRVCWVYREVPRPDVPSFELLICPGQLIVRGSDRHTSITLGDNESLFDYFYPGHTETNFVTVFGM